MSQVYLVRHARTAETGWRLSGRRPGIGLSDAGRREADALSRALEPIAPAQLFSSPLERAAMTAETIAGRCHTDLEIVEGLNEIDFGDWTGRTFDELEPDDGWRTFNARPSLARIPGGSESLEDVGRRGAEAIRALATRFPRRPVVAVTHGDVIRLALARLLGMTLDDFRRLTIAPASVSCVSIGEGAALVSLINHLPGGLDGEDLR